jgi:hypothetical protein
MSKPRPPARKCEDITKEGLPCPANARRRPDPDGQHRCPQHTLEPAVREAIRLARQRGSWKTMEVRHAGDPVVDGQRYLTAESLDVIFDEALNVMRMELRIRKANKGQAATAIVALADAKLRIRQMSWMANANRRLHPAPPSPPA